MVQYSIQPDKVADIAVAYGTQESLDAKLPRIIEERAKIAVSESSAMMLIENRSTLSPDVLELVKELESTYYVHISNVALVDIAFSDQFENAVENKMLAEQAKLQAEYDKKKAEIKAEEEKSVAITKAEADLEVSKRNAEAALTVAKGEADAQREIQSAWGAITSEVREIMLKQQYLETWDGQLPRVSLGDSDILINPNDYIN